MRHVLFTILRRQILEHVFLELSVTSKGLPECSVVFPEPTTNGRPIPTIKMCFGPKLVNGSFIVLQGFPGKLVSEHPAVLTICIRARNRENSPDGVAPVKTGISPVTAQSHNDLSDQHKRDSKHSSRMSCVVRKCLSSYVCNRTRGSDFLGNFRMPGEDLLGNNEGDVSIVVENGGGAEI
jgi:hypothetical protein